MSSPSPTPLQQTALAPVHPEWGARMVEFAGWLMPVQYSGILDEHNAVRTTAGLFDISHMGEVFVSGPDAAAWLNGLLTNDITRLSPGEGHYTLLCNLQGGVIDDLIAYRLSSDQYLLIVNASKIEEDVAWLTHHLPASGVTLEDRSDRMAALALQGPAASAVYSAFFGSQAVLPQRNQITRLPWNASEILAARTGYTGEDGFEFFFPTAIAREVWEKLLKAGEAHGIKPCGLGCRDTLRLEMCYPLNGNDLSAERTPLQAGLGFFVSLEKTADFPGKTVMRAQKQNGLSEKLVPFRMNGKSAPPRAHYTVWAGDQKIGETTSGCLSPSLNAGIGLAYINAAFARIDQPVEIEVRGTKYPATLVKKPFYRKS